MDKHVLKIKIAVLAYFEKDGKILLQKRKNTGWRDGWYGLVAGHVDEGEPYKYALCREIKEEAGVDVLEKDLEFAHFLSIPSKISDCDRQFFYFVVKKWVGEPRNTEPEKCDGVEWFDKLSLPENLIPVVKSGMDKMLAGEKYSEFGWEEGYSEKS
ncbi:hypothetical protein A2473_02075 [candidate division WWE3 bacterium RIFOXYC2_FULL_42_13]|nr:MAG: hypothetical protein A2473_02075 [candidate division WWE3 bacterium RIFOXYC2_FULL_42_13]